LSATILTDDALDEALRALAHPERRRLVVACLDGWMAAGALADGATLSLATVSEHLKVLRKTGLVELQREGRYWLYRTDPVVLDRVIEALGRLKGD